MVGAVALQTEGRARSMREYRGDHSRGISQDAGQGAEARGIARPRTAEEQAIARAHHLRQEAESADARAKDLAAITQREEWRAERDNLLQMHRWFLQQLEREAAGAHASEQAQRHRAAARRALGELEAMLANAKEPRARPLVHGEEAIESRIAERTIPPDDVLAWATELSSGQRRALAERVRCVQGGVDRSDTFGVALANYLAATRTTSQFFGVMENPRRFNRAAYEKVRSPASSKDAAAHAGGEPTPTAKLQASVPATATPFPLDSTSPRTPSELPHRAEMEQSFGRPLGHIQAYTGLSHELAAHGARALATGDVVAFADAAPSPELVAHEVTHVVQNEHAGAAMPMASGNVAPRESSAEAEADANARRVIDHGPGVRLPPVAAAPAADLHLTPKVLQPDPDLSPHPTILVPDANHPAQRDVDGEQVVQTGLATAPGKSTALGVKSWKSIAEVAESLDVQDDSGDTLHIDLTYRLESRPSEIGEVPDLWIHTERKALLAIDTGEHARATIVGQARIHLGPGEPRDPRAAIGKPSIGPDHWAQIYLAEAGQYVNLHGPRGRSSLRADAADNDVLAYDDPLRMLVGLKNLLKQRHVAGHGSEVAQQHARAQRLLANTEIGRAILEREIAGIKSHRDPHPGRVAPVRFLVSDIAEWLAANQHAGRDDTEDARQLRRARVELEQRIADVETAYPSRRDLIDDALYAPLRLAERTVEGVKEVGSMAVDATALGIDALGEATGLGSFDYHPISKYGNLVEATGSNATTALVTMVNGFADEWSDAMERAQHGDYRGIVDVSIDTLLLIDGTRTGGMIALDKAEAIAAKLDIVARSARSVMYSVYASNSAVPAEVRNIVAAMTNSADAFLARLQAGGMQMATAGGGEGHGPTLGGLSAETLAEAAQAAKDAFKDKRTAQPAPEHREGSVSHADSSHHSPDPGPTSSHGELVRRIKTRVQGAGREFTLLYTDTELDTIITHGDKFGLPEKMIEDLVYVGARARKAIPAPELMEQMTNWSMHVALRGFPYRFDDLAQYKEFSKDLLDGVQRATLPADDVRVQGSSLRKPTANDVDIAVFVDETVFDKMLVERFDGRITHSGAKISLGGRSHTELARLARDIEAHPSSYNAQGSTFQNALKTGIINSKSDIIKSLKQIRVELAAKYPGLNIEAISVLLRGGRFDLLPDLPVRLD